jgi:hypothetical protein
MAGFEVTTHGRFWVTPEANLSDSVSGNPSAIDSVIKSRGIPLSGRYLAELIVLGSVYRSVW